MNNVLILNYHRIVADEEWDIKKIEDKFTVKKSDFLKQLELIKAKNIPIISIEDWLSGTVRSTFAVVLTFDDGHKSDFDIVLPILKEQEITATFFPVLSFVNKPDRTTWSDLLQMVTYGCQIGSHGLLHKNMRRMGKEGCKLELELSKRMIETKLKTEVNLFAVPYGLYSLRILQLAVNAGYHKVFSTRVKINKGHESLVLNRWNLKHTTSINTVEKMLKQGSTLYYRKSILSKLKGQFSRSFGIGFINKANSFMLKLIDK